MIFVTLGYTVYMAYHYYKLKKQGGALIKEYTSQIKCKDCCLCTYSPWNFLFCNVYA